MPHFHILSECRICGNRAQKSVHRNLSEAQQVLKTVEKDLASDAARTISVMDDDLIRIKIGEHDLIVFTGECDLGPYEECLARHKQMLMAALMAERMETMLTQMLGSGNMERLNEELKALANEANTPDSTPPTTKDRSANILNQLNLPDDFLGGKSN